MVNQNEDNVTEMPKARTYRKQVKRFTDGETATILDMLKKQTPDQAIADFLKVPLADVLNRIQAMAVAGYEWGAEPLPRTIIPIQLAYSLADIIREVSRLSTVALELASDLEVLEKQMNPGV